MSEENINPVKSERRWAPIFDGVYEVSDDGIVRRAEVPLGRTVKGKILSPYRDPAGYEIVSICLSGVPKKFRIHELVATAFIGPKPSPRHEVNHLDGLKTNNLHTNLEWTTKNMEHAYATGLNHTGESHHWCKFSDETIREMRNLRAQGETVKRISEKFGIEVRYTRRIVSGESRRYT